MMVLKKLFALALAVSFPLLASAQTPAEPAKPAAEPPAAAPPATPPPTPPIQVYGTLNVNLQYTEASGATAANADVEPRFAISTDSTNIGVRGALDLVPGYKAVYQCETQANLDGEDTRTICNRNSRIGLQASWGTLFYGNWDTPFKNGHYGTKADDVFGNTDVVGFNGLMGSPGYGVRSSGFNGSANPGAPTIVTASFDQRAGNSVAYWSPKFSGLSGKVQYSLPEFTSANGTVNPSLISAVVNYDRGPLSVVANAEYHEDTFGIRVINTANVGNMTATDIAWRVAAGYELPLSVGALTVMGMFEQLSYSQDDTTVGYKDYSRMAWLLGAKFRTGPHEFRARYSQALGPDITAANGTTLAANAEDNLGASSFAVGYALSLAKSTQVYVFYSSIMNEDAARYTFPVGGAAAVVAANTPAGSTLSAGGLGMRVAF